MLALRVHGCLDREPVALPRPPSTAAAADAMSRRPAAPPASRSLPWPSAASLRDPAEIRSARPPCGPAMWVAGTRAGGLRADAWPHTAPGGPCRSHRVDPLRHSTAQPSGAPASAAMRRHGQAARNAPPSPPTCAAGRLAAAQRQQLAGPLVPVAACSAPIARSLNGSQQDCYCRFNYVVAPLPAAHHLRLLLQRRLVRSDRLREALVLRRAHHAKPHGHIRLHTCKHNRPSGGCMARGQPGSAARTPPTNPARAAHGLSNPPHPQRRPRTSTSPRYPQLTCLSQPRSPYPLLLGGHHARSPLGELLLKRRLHAGHLSLHGLAPAASIHQCCQCLDFASACDCGSARGAAPCRCAAGRGEGRTASSCGTAR